MNEKMVVIMALVMGAVIAGCGVAYVYRDKLKKALAEPKETALFLAAQLQDFFEKDSTKEAVKTLCQLAEHIIDSHGGNKLAFVTGKLYSMVPVYLQEVVTVEKLQEIVNAVYEEIKVYVDGHWVAGDGNGKT